MPDTKDYFASKIAELFEKYSEMTKTGYSDQERFDIIEAMKKEFSNQLKQFE